MPLTVQDQILNFLKAVGPVLPSTVAKNIKDSILIASAHLADLVTQGRVRITHLKIGGSPLYYLSGQEAQLYPFAAGNMNPKDLQVLNHLKSSWVLRESSLDTLSKVALRSLQDFAVPLHVYVQDKKELFWKWFLLPEEETNRLIGQLLTAQAQVVEQALPPPIVTVSEPTARIESERVEAKEVEKDKGLEKKELETPPLEIVQEKPLVLKPSFKASEPEVKTKKRVPKSTIKEKVKEIEPASEEEPEEDDLAELLLEESHLKAEQKRQELERQTTLKPAKENFLKKIKDKLSGRGQVADKFLSEVEDFFDKLKIKVQEKEMIRKNSELEFIIGISSVVGETAYFCKARKKKKCDEKDLSAAYMQAQIKKLPLLFLYTQELNSKAKEMLETDAFKNALIKKIE